MLLIIIICVLQSKIYWYNFIFTFNNNIIGGIKELFRLRFSKTWVLAWSWVLKIQVWVKYNRTLITQNSVSIFKSSLKLGLNYLWFHLIYNNNILFTSKLYYEHFTPGFWLHNNICEFPMPENICTHNFRFKDFWYTNIFLEDFPTVSM